MRPRIFVSYRRKDSEAVVGRLVDDLRRAFPQNQVFQDWASIAPGEDFVDALERELGSCAAALVVIGPRWLSALEETGQRRIDNPDDWVRREIAECLQRKDVRVFPLLVDGATMPDAADLPEPIRGLARRQAYPIVTRHWAKDVDTLVSVLHKVPELNSSTGSTPPRTHPKSVYDSTRDRTDESQAASSSGATSSDGSAKSSTGGGALLGSIMIAVAVAIPVGFLVFINGNQSSPNTPPTSLATEPDAVPAPTAGAQATRDPGRAAQPTKVATLKPGETFRDCATCPEMVVVPAGEFVMGSPKNESGPAETEGPQHRVRIARPFAVGKYEVTFADWDGCFDAGGCKHKPDDKGWGRGTQPVIFVNWHHAQDYTTWLSKKTGKRYRLLSEAEWEYAARAGSTSRYPWGDEPGWNQANFKRSGSQWSGKQTAPAGSFAPNAFGLHDMIGNVWEWVADCYHDSYDGAPSDGSAWTTGECNSRMMRGGSWNAEPPNVRSAFRLGRTNVIPDSYAGFRLARDLD